MAASMESPSRYPWPPDAFTSRMPNRPPAPPAGSRAARPRHAGGHAESARECSRVLGPPHLPCRPLHATAALEVCLCARVCLRAGGGNVPCTFQPDARGDAWSQPWWTCRGAPARSLPRIARPNNLPHRQISGSGSAAPAAPGGGAPHGRPARHRGPCYPGPGEGRAPPGPAGAPGNRPFPPPAPSGPALPPPRGGRARCRPTSRSAHCVSPPSSRTTRSSASGCASRRGRGATRGWRAGRV